MKKIFLKTTLGLLLVLLFSSCLSFPIVEGVHQSSLFVAGKEGYTAYRIPSLINVDGHLLAFAEGRVNGFGDSGNIDMVMKRSDDGGAHWSALSVIWDDDENTCGNPAPVVIPREGQNSRILMVGTWNLGEDHESEMLQKRSKGKRQIFTFYSDDYGLTWSEPVNITETVAEESWAWLATGPGVSLRLQNGEQAGRMIVPADGYDVNSKAYFSFLFYSDDDGATWNRGAIAPLGTNECQVVETPNGKLWVQARRIGESLPEEGRIFLTSEDGGLSFTDSIDLRKELQTPMCQASLMKDSVGPSYYFSSPIGTSRQNLTLYITEEPSEKWNEVAVLWKEAAAYSCLAQDKEQVFLVYECGGLIPYSQIVFAKVAKDRASELSLEKIMEKVPKDATPKTTINLENTNSASVAVIGGAEGPTEIYLTTEGAE